MKYIPYLPSPFIKIHSIFFKYFCTPLLLEVTQIINYKSFLFGIHTIVLPFSSLATPNSVTSQKISGTSYHVFFIIIHEGWNFGKNNADFSYSKLFLKNFGCKFYIYLFKSFLSILSQYRLDLITKKLLSNLVYCILITDWTLWLSGYRIWFKSGPKPDSRPCQMSERWDWILFMMINDILKINFSMEVCV